MYVVVFLKEGGLNCEQKVFGPFATLPAAQKQIEALPPVIDCEHKYINTLTPPDLGDGGV